MLGVGHFKLFFFFFFFFFFLQNAWSILFKIGDAHLYRLYPLYPTERAKGVNRKHLSGSGEGQSVYIVLTLIREECIYSWHYLEPPPPLYNWWHTSSCNKGRLHQLWISSYSSCGLQSLSPLGLLFYEIWLEFLNLYKWNGRIDIAKSYYSLFCIICVSLPQR